MSIRPVDMQGVVQRTSEMQRTTAISREQQQHIQHQFMHELQHVSARAQQMVRQSDDTELGDLRREQEQEQRRQSEQRARQGKRKQTDAPADDATRGRHLDIKA